MVAVCIATLFAGYLLKERCSDPGANQYRDLCYNDIQPLYGIRGIQAGTFPYVQGELVDGELVGGAIEYPVLTGVFMWAAGLFAETYVDYLYVTALLLAPFGVGAAYLLARMTGLRALLFAAAPAIVLYAFHNWDLLVVAAVVAGVWAWYRDKATWAAVALGIGAALKMYPALFLLPLALQRWRLGDRRGAVQSLGAGVATFVAINLPFALINFEGWWATYAFHQRRLPNFDTVWLLGLQPDGDVIMSAEGFNRLTTILILLSFAAAVVIGWRRAVLNREDYPFLQVSGAALVAFLLWNKVHSPQYVLWLLPFFALLRVNIGWWIAYSLADLAVYAGIFRWFYDYASSQDIAESTGAKNLLLVGIWMRAGLLLALYVVFLRARSALDSEPHHGKASQPSRRLEVTAGRPAPG